MTKIKMLVAAMLLGLSGLVSATDLTHGLKIMEGDTPVLEMGVTYFGMTKPEHAQLLVAENKFLNTVEQVAKTAKAQAARDKNRVSPYTVALSGKMVDDAGKVTDYPPMIYDSLTLRDVNKIMRANQSYSNTLVGNSEQAAAKGKKPWGNK